MGRLISKSNAGDRSIPHNWASTILSSILQHFHSACTRFFFLDQVFRKLVEIWSSRYPPRKVDTEQFVWKKIEFELCKWSYNIHMLTFFLRVNIHTLTRKKKKKHTYANLSREQTIIYTTILSEPVAVLQLKGQKDYWPRVRSHDLCERRQRGIETSSWTTCWKNCILTLL